MIVSMRLGVSDRLPSERGLAEQFGVNHQTIRKALSFLVSDGIVERRVGSGTYLLVDQRELADIRALERSSSIVHDARRVGLLMPVDDNAFATELIGRLHQQAEDRNVHLLIRTVRSFSDEAVEVVDQMRRQRCGAVILPWVPAPRGRVETRELVKKACLPIVTGFSIVGAEGHCYEPPEFFGRADSHLVELPCTWLKRLGYSAIALLERKPQDETYLSHRVMAFNRFISDNGPGRFDVAMVGSSSRDMAALVDRWKDYYGDLAVVCHDDNIAVRLMTAMHKAGLSIPEDVAVVGVNNIPLGLETDPPLTTVQFDHDYVAGAMLDHAIAMADGGSNQSCGPVHHKLVVRESCGARLRLSDKLLDTQKEFHAQVKRKQKSVSKAVSKLVAAGQMS